MKNRPYLITTNPDFPKYIRCLTCNKTSYNPDDIYYRFCTRCGFLGDEVRWKWGEASAREYLKQIVAECGLYKKVRNIGDSTWHAVPTERIATEGVKGYEICHFPIWTDAHEKNRVPQKIDDIVVLSSEDFDPSSKT